MIVNVKEYVVRVREEYNESRLLVEREMVGVKSFVMGRVE